MSFTPIQWGLILLGEVAGAVYTSRRINRLSNRLGAEIDRSNAQLAAPMTVRFDQLTPPFDRTKARTNQGFAPVNERFDSRTSEMNGRFEQTAAQIAQVSARSDDQIRQVTVRMDDRFEHFEKQMDHHSGHVSTRIDDLIRSDDARHTDLKDFIRSEVHRLEDRIEHNRPTVRS